jgi:DNA-binding transcriptional LysR family regulator
MSQLGSLRYFYHVAKLGSMRAAAQALHVAPSAVSRMVSKIEHEYQTELFERRKKGVRLTAAGELLAAQLNSVFQQLRDVRSQIDELRGLHRGEVRLYCIEGIVSDMVPTLLATLQRRHPHISYFVYLASTDRIADAVVNDEADIGITFNVARRPDVSVVVSHQEPLRVLVAPGHPLAKRRKVALERVMQYPVAMPGPSFGVRRVLDKALASRGLSQITLLTTNSIELTRAMARSGAAITFAPPFAARREIASGELIAVQIEEQSQLMGRLDVCIRKGRRLPAAAATLLEEIRGFFPGLKRSRADQP